MLSSGGPGPASQSDSGTQDGRSGFNQVRRFQFRISILDGVGVFRFFVFFGWLAIQLQ